ncbi:MAG TPA: MBL fold metallo-hydrolase [Actinoplanes sp.]|nr:MBL fold metallo-hydrolase [Actinoplanes sp.]
MSRKSVVFGAAALAGAAAAAGAIAWALRDIPDAMGAPPSGERADRVRRSAHFRDGKFHNTVPATMLPANRMPRTLLDFFFGRQRREPSGPVPLVTPTAGPAAEGVHVIWYGHSSALVEIEGRRVLFDPVWSERCSPSQRVGPRRLHAPPVPLDGLPPVDAIVISHDHYDHLDTATVRVLTGTQSAPFLVPLGVGAHLERWGVPADRIMELDWDDSVTVAGLRFVATAARHFSGRAFTRDTTLWASWALIGDTHRVFYTGDSGYFDGYAAIGEKYGPFDATLIQIGAYGPGWPDIHMTPEDGAAAHLDVRGRVLIPLHWATFNLALHDWSEPADRLWAEAKARGITLAVPRPGERVDVADPPAVDGWWQSIA